MRQLVRNAPGDAARPNVKGFCLNVLTAGVKPGQGGVTGFSTHAHLGLAAMGAALR